MPRPADKCCGRCKTPWGVCATKKTCQHHRDAQWEQSLYDLSEASKSSHRYSSDATKVRVR